MKPILTEETVEVPEGVIIRVEKKKVEVWGPKGRNERNFEKALVQLEVTEDGRTLYIRCWLGDRKAGAMVPTIAAHVRNMINGVLAGYEVRTRLVYQHFPIRQEVSERGTVTKISNYMGRRERWTVTMPEGVKVVQPDTVTIQRNLADEKLLQGVDLEKVTQAAALLRTLKPGDKDPVKFRDGIYRVSLSYIDKEILGRERP